MTTNSKYRQVIAIILLIASTYAFGTNRNEAVISLNIADGLTGESVYYIMSDHGGRMWMATDNGINMYNGKRLTSYNLTDNEHRLVTVNALCETHNHTIYAASNIGLFKLSLGRSCFEKIMPEVQHPECLMAVGDTVFIGGRQGIQIYDGKRLNSIQLGQSRKGIDNIVRHYVQTIDGRVWFLGRYELYLLNRNTGEFVKQNISELLPEHATPSQFDIIGNLCFVGTKADGLYVINLKTRECKRISEVGHIVTSVKRNGEKYICVATNGAGAFLVDAKTCKVEYHFNTMDSSAIQLPTNALNYYYRDEQGVDWFGMVRYGLVYVPHSDTLFKQYTSGDFSSAGINVRSFCLNGNESIIGTYNGLYFIKDGKSHFFSADMMGGGHIVNNIVYYRGEYYIGTFDGGITVLNPQTLTMRQLPFSQSLRKSAIGDMKIGPDGLLWVGSNDGLFLIDDKQVHKWYTELNSHIQGGIILDITFDKVGNAWLTGSSGLSLYSGQTKVIIADPNFPDDFFHQQPWFRGCIGHDSILFMRNGPQVFYTDYNMKHYGELYLPISLPDVWSRDFVDDMAGYYWLSSEMGLFRMDYESKGMVRLGSGAGLKGNHINEMSYDGKYLWVATSEGLFYMKLEAFDSWAVNNSYKINLFNMRRGSDLLSSGEELKTNESKQIALSWNFCTEVLFVEPVLLDYAQQTGRLYEYKVDENEWIMVQSNAQIVLRNLSLGKHKLCVRLAGIQGTETEYTMRVQPSIGAIVEFVALVLLLVLIWIGYRYHRNTKVLLSERDEIEEALIAVEQELEETRFDETVQTDIRNEKYQKVKMDTAECEEIVKRMCTYIEQNKVYTNIDLKMKDLAEVLHLSPSKLSQVFNLYMKESYYDFINRYRLDEFKRLINCGEHKRVTITALSERCGFKKSSFFSTFRKIEGMTPAEYLKKNG